MNMSRREFLQMLAVASAAGFSLTACESDSGNGQGAPATKAPSKKAPSDYYELSPYGNVSVMHYTDCHGQLLPIYFREPNINLGIGDMRGNAPHLVGEQLLKQFNLEPGTRDAHAFTYLNFVEAARKYGTVGGFAHLSTLVKNVRAQRPGALLLDGGDTWGGGSATGLWTNAQDMVDAQKLLGVDVTTGHWEFTFGADRVREVVENDYPGHIDFVAQNVVDNDWGERIFDPFVIKEINGVPVAVIGQAFPYTPIANPRFMVPDWSFGIRDDSMQKVVDEARGKGAQVVIVLSHNGMDVDLKMASRVSGIDAIMGGHTHDAVPSPVEVSNTGGKTLVTNAGSNGKFLGVLDLDVRDGKVRGYEYKLLPVFSNLIEPDAGTASYIEKVRGQEVTFQGETFNMKQRLMEELAVSDELLYRRGNFNGTFDQLICDALMAVQDAQIAFSPGFRWGVSVLPNQPITFEHVMTHTALTYPVVTRNEMTGEFIKTVLEDVGDNLFNKDPYYQQGGDMVRVGGLKYAIDPTKEMGSRISDMTLNGEPIDPQKTYTVAGWASVQEPLEGRPIWDVVAEYLRDQKTVKISELNVPSLKGVEGNPGLAV
ncbi:MAG: thiosulfohydrolase SoxB [Gammaproteobacteria bacterium]|nr:thiosulfohydrolase SoxB [Gammaproteobacteria bacterium]NIR97827.1 thiosulfohydrolase SoxB [Gammaproteobacteria bacterium]NIT63527.1 thiosulfohydrolase SoxB [Gammaproteobacteria bacterium]NIV20474.1 thiosulfohydrolase SoxB [Gammaproteobacteria bacterium]NIX11056.1 thiosulfohydrolase SoxB [Gammaproteobacteria bacterium]